MTSLVDELIDLYEPITRACCWSHRLSEDLVDDVKLYYWHHKNTYEIAMRLQVEPSTIRVILHRSRQRLRRELEGMYAA